MSNFELTEDLLTGIEDVDTQHRMLLELADDIVETADDEKGAAFFERTSAFLKDYVAYHFASEEMAMLQYKYPKFDAHRQHHANIGVELESLVLKVRAKGFTKEVNAQYCFFVEDHLVRHIRTYDREMATFFRTHNIQVSLPKSRTSPQSGFDPELDSSNARDVPTQSTQADRTIPHLPGRRQTTEKPATFSHVNCIPFAPMRILIVEDDMTSRFLLRKMLEPLGRCEVAVNGKEAVEAFQHAHETGTPYTLVCLDVMMPEMDGHAVLKVLRAQEEFRAIPPSRAAKIVMTTALRDLDNMNDAYRERCDGYLAKPIVRDKLLGLLMDLGLITVRADT